MKQDHPDLSKAEKKRLCRILDCQKLSPDVRAHAVKNERLPLRTVVQLLFFEQERGTSTTTATATANNHHMMSKLSLQDHTPRGKHTPASTTASRSNDQSGKLKLASDDKSVTAGSEAGDRERLRRTAKLARADSERKAAGKGEIEEVEAAMSVSKLDVRKMTRKGSKGRDR